MIERLKRILIQVAPNTDLDEIRPETRLIADLHGFYHADDGN